LEILKIIEEMFGEVPAWAGKMNESEPKALEHLLKFQQEVMAEGHISKKEKELILVGVNAARRYENSMLYHAKGAIDAGATLREFVEILTPCILSRGIPAWFEGLKAIQYAEKYSKKSSAESTEKDVDFEFQNVDESLAYFKEEAGGVKAEWVKVMEEEAADVLLHYGNLRASILKDGIMPRKLKEFVLVAINVAERYEKGIELHVNSARKLGATDEEIAEVTLLGFLASGLPEWFEGSEFIQGS